MNTFVFSIISSEKEIFKGEITKVFLRGEEGDFAVMKGHIPFVTTVNPCKCKIKFKDGTEDERTVDGGIFVVTEDSAKIIIVSL